jgi:hypothetical protein
MGKPIFKLIMDFQGTLNSQTNIEKEQSFELTLPYFKTYYKGYFSVVECLPSMHSPGFNPQHHNK